MKIRIEDNCTACGLCVDTCPEVFAIGDHIAEVIVDKVPPESEDAWTDDSLPCCMNRHNGFVSAVFMDFSSRKVGVKELWTLKWHREFDIAGSWTKAGGVQPENWPQWMKSFKEY